MFKLVIVSGKHRGKEYILEDAVTVGRSAEASICLAEEGVSKKHFTIYPSSDSCFLEDEGSSNGTFVNDELVKKKTIKNGDKISIPNIIFQLVYLEEKKVIVKKKISKSDDVEMISNDYMAENPQNILGKVRYFFKTKVMSVIYSFNEQYEWNTLLGILLFIFIAGSIGLTIGPVLYDSENFLLKEVAARGTQYAKEVSRFNARSLQSGDLDRINTSFLDNDVEGVVSYELFDTDGRIVRPINKLNTRINDSFSVNAKFFYKNYENINKTNIARLNDGQIGISRAITAHNVQTGQQEAVGVIAIRFKPASISVQASNNATAYFEALIITSIVGIIFFGMVYYMTRRPIDEMKFQIEEVLRGQRRELESKFLFEEIHPLRSSVNSVLQRLREFQEQDTGEYVDIEEDTKYIRTFYEVMQGIQGSAMILNSEKNIEHINSECEDLIGIRESSSSGTSLMDSARDQGFAATVIDLCDRSANSEGVHQSESYELIGRDHLINVSALIGKDNFAKSYLITFIAES